MATIEERNYDREDNGAIIRKQLAAISLSEVQIFNRDYNRLIDEEQSGRAARILEAARMTQFEVTRHVMDRSNQNYGGAMASGDEVGIQMLRPDHVEMGVTVTTGTANTFDFTWDTLAEDDAFGNAADEINLGDNALAEAHLIVGWATNHPAPKTESIQGNKFGRDLIVQPLPWDVVAAERNNVKVLEANPWFLALPGETYRFDVNVTVIGTDVLRPLGVFCSVGTQLRLMLFVHA